MHQVLTIVRKDLLLEWRGRARATSVVLFGVVILVLFSFAVGPTVSALRGGAPGFLALALLLSSLLSLQESFRLEEEDRALEGLLMHPVSPYALFYGKALGNTVFLIGLAFFLIPVAVVLYSLEVDASSLLGVLALWALSSAALAAPGTLYAAMTSRARNQDVALPLLLFPLVVPVLLGSVKAIALVLSGDPMQQTRSWTVLLAGFAAIYWSVCGVLFPAAVEETS